MSDSTAFDPWEPSPEMLAVGAARDGMHSSAIGKDRSQLLDHASAYLAARATERGGEPRPDMWWSADDEAVATLLLGRSDEARTDIGRTFRHKCEASADGDPPSYDGLFADLDAYHIERCGWLVGSLAVIRLMTADWTPLPERALAWQLGESFAFDRAGDLRPKANVLAAFATRDAGRARRALSQMERNDNWTFDEVSRFDLLAGALYAEASKLDLLELPDRYAAFGESGTARGSRRGTGSHGLG